VLIVGKFGVETLTLIINAHNTLWGSDHTDNNGEVVEEFIEERSLYCLNDGRGTRVDAIRNSVSCLDLTLVSVNMSNICEWDIKNDTNIGSLICTFKRVT